MLISEFIDRTGFRPSHECYEKHIEPQYNSSNLDKDEWCKQWKRKGGIAEAYQWQVVFDTAKINEAKEEANSNQKEIDRLNKMLKAQTDMTDRLNQDKKELQEKLNEQIKANNDLNATMCQEADQKAEMTVFLIEQAEKWGATDLREKAIEIMGAKEYIAYKIDHDLNLWQLDKDLILQLLNQ